MKVCAIEAVPHHGSEQLGAACGLKSVNGS